MMPVSCKNKFLKKFITSNPYRFWTRCCKQAQEHSRCLFLHCPPIRNPRDQHCHEQMMGEQIAWCQPSPFSKMGTIRDI